MRTGDLELFTMNIDGSDVRQITNEVGYDGAAYFSPDRTKIPHQHRSGDGANYQIFVTTTTVLTDD